MEIVVPVKLDKKTFMRFAVRDMLVIRRRWIRPFVFLLIMVAFASAALLSGKQQSGLIAAVLLAVGICLPLVYIGTFLSRVNLQAERYKLEKPHLVYTVRLNREGVYATNNLKKEEPLFVPWQETYRCYKSKKCLYLYVQPKRAFLLPSGQASVSDQELWDYVQRQMGQEKCKA